MCMSGMVPVQRCLIQQHISGTLNRQLAGVATSFPLYPLETARTRMTINGDKYKNLAITLSTVVRQEGFGALYQVRCITVHRGGLRPIDPPISSSPTAKPLLDM